MTSSTGIFLLSLLCYTSAIRAQDVTRPSQTDRTIQLLVDAGFENVRAVETDDELIVSYENRRYRYEIRAFKEVLALVAPLAGAGQSVTLVQERNGIPLRSVTVSAQQVVNARSRSESERPDVMVNAGIEVADVWTRLRNAPIHSASYRKFDLVIRPLLTAQFGNYSDALQTQIAVVPELTSTVAAGLAVRAQVILPLQNDLAEEGDFVRPGLVSIGQILRFRSDTFVALSAGYFSANRYGVDVQGRTYFTGSRFAIGWRAGLTGFAGIRGGSWTHSSMGRFTGSVTTDFFVPEYGLMARSSLERFIYGDFGWRLEVNRTFGEVELGFFGSVSEGENNAGFRISIPLPGRNYGRPGPLRLRPAQRFDWEYRYRGFPYSGMQYDTGHELDRIWEGVYPSFFEDQLEPKRLTMHPR